jgi:hypothetical protein
LNPGKIHIPVKVGEAKKQCSIGFQPVSRDHGAWPCEIGNDVLILGKEIVAVTGYLFMRENL